MYIVLGSKIILLNDVVYIESQENKCNGFTQLLEEFKKMKYLQCSTLCKITGKPSEQ